MRRCGVGVRSIHAGEWCRARHVGRKGGSGGSTAAAARREAAAHQHRISMAGMITGYPQGLSWLRWCLHVGRAAALTSAAEVGHAGSFDCDGIRSEGAAEVAAASGGSAR